MVGTARTPGYDRVAASGAFERSYGEPRAPLQALERRKAAPSGRMAAIGDPASANLSPKAEGAAAMIVSASYRTDIPAFYGDWFMNRLAAGFARVANPYGGPPYRVSLDRAAVDGFVFWTKNLEPFLSPLEAVARRGYPFTVQYTINGYPRVLETSVVDAPRAVAHMHGLARDYGAHAAVWRYDPVLLTTLTPPDWHLENFSALAAALEGATDEVVVSFAHIYRKSARNLGAAARTHGFGWEDPDEGRKREMAAQLTRFAAEHGMGLKLCAQPEYSAGGAGAARCIDAGRMALVAGRPISAPEKGNRPGCACHASRDIGAYDTCPHGCVYCYAVGSRSLAQRRFKAHDPAGEALFALAPKEALSS